MSLLANRHSALVIVLLIVVGTTASNLRAGNAAVVQGLTGHRSIVGNLTVPEEEQVEIVDDVAFTEDTTYLASSAISAYEGIISEEYNGTDDGLYVDDETEFFALSPFGTAVRVGPEIEAGASRPATRTKIETYVVQPGDAIGSIARRFGLKTSTLLSANKLTARSYIHPGQSLKILPYDGIVYTVKSGDTVAKIATKYSSEAAKIIEANQLASGTSIKIGMELMLPDGKTPPPPAPKRPTRIATNIRRVFEPSPQRSRSGMVWPTAARRITQYWRGRLHTGVDIAGPTGTPIYASDDGVVMISGWNRGGYGNMILVNHGGGLYTRYAHNSKMFVRVGDTVKKGETIALMGSTGRSTGPHIHFEVMVGSPRNRVNPFDYVR